MSIECITSMNKIHACMENSFSHASGNINHIVARIAKKLMDKEQKKY